MSSKSYAASLSRADTMWVRANHKEIACVPPPYVSWRWSDVELSQSMLMSLRTRSLISQGDDGRWSVSRSLYAYLESEWGVDGSWVVDAPDDGGQARFSRLAAPGEHREGDVYEMERVESEQA